MDLSIVIPVYNESLKIAGDIASAAEFLREKGIRGEIIIADDGSEDQTANTARGIRTGEVIQLHVVGYPEHRGKGYGKMLVHHIFDKARQSGARRVEIAMISKDRKLKNWYKKFGFIQKGTKQFDHLPFTVAFMYRPLNREEA